MVEFVLISPLIFLLVGGIIQLALALNYWMDMQRIANQGASWAVVARYPLPDGDLLHLVDRLVHPARSRTLSPHRRRPQSLDPRVSICFPERIEQSGRSRAGPPRDRFLVRTHSRYRHGDPRCRR